MLRHAVKTQFGQKIMDINKVVAEIRNHPDIKNAGMVLVHLGLVRSFNLKGQKVDALNVKPDLDKAEKIRTELLKRKGVVEVVVRLNEGELTVGDPIMIAAVAGDTRETVFPVLQELIERIKTEASEKKESVHPV